MATVTKTDKIQTLTVVGSVVTATYPSIGKSLSCDYSKLHANMQFASGIHGLTQKMGDAASGKTPQEKYDMCARIIASITDPVNPSWNLTTRETSIEDVVNAVCKLANKKAEDVVASLTAMTAEAAKAKVTEWRGNPHVKLEILKQAEAKLKAGLDKGDKFVM